MKKLILPLFVATAAILSSCSSEDDSVQHPMNKKSDNDARPTIAELASIGDLEPIPSSYTPQHADWAGDIYLYSDQENSDVEVYAITPIVSTQDLSDFLDDFAMDRPVSYVTTGSGVTVISCPNQSGECCQVTVHDNGDVDIVLAEE
jgi:hypothetical protein